MYRAKITVDNTTINLGHYETYEQAVKARQEAELLFFGFYKE